MSFLPNHDVTFSEKRRQQREYHWALDNQMNGKPRKGGDRGEAQLPSISQKNGGGGQGDMGQDRGHRQHRGGGPHGGGHPQPPAGSDSFPSDGLSDSVFKELDAVKHQFGSLEQHVLAELNARKVAEKSFIVPQLELLNETVAGLQVELSESKQMNKTLFQMIKDLKTEDRMAEERIMSAHSAQLSEFDLVRADVRSLSAKVQSIASGDSGSGGNGAHKGMDGDIRLLESKLEAAIEDVKQQQVQQTDSVMAFFNGKMYQDLLKRLENTEKKCNIEVASLRMNSDIENDAVKLKLSEVQAGAEAEHKLLHANINSVVLEFNSLKAVTRSEIDETLSRLECVEKTWDNTVGDGLRSLHGDLSKGLTSCQNQHEELKCVVSAEITARRKTDKKQLAALQALSDQLKRELNTMQQDIVNTANHSNSRVLSVENSVSMVASSFTSQLASLQESTGQAVKMLREEISAKGIVNKSRVMGDSKSLKEVIEDVLKLSRRVEEFEYANNARATTITTEIADFMQNVAIKFEEVEDLVRRESNNRDKEVRKLHTAVSGAIIAQSQKMGESTNHTMNKIRQATVAILEVMDRKLDDLEQRIAEKESSDDVKLRTSTQSAQSMLRPNFLDSEKYQLTKGLDVELDSNPAIPVESLEAGSVAPIPPEPIQPMLSSEIELSVARLRDSFGNSGKNLSEGLKIVATNSMSEELEKHSPRLDIADSPSVFQQGVDVSVSVDSLVDVKPDHKSSNGDSRDGASRSGPSMLDASKAAGEEVNPAEDSAVGPRRGGFAVPDDQASSDHEGTIVSLKSDSATDDDGTMSTGQRGEGTNDPSSIMSTPLVPSTVNQDGASMLGSSDGASIAQLSQASSAASIASAFQAANETASRNINDNGGESISINHEDVTQSALVPGSTEALRSDVIALGSVSPSTESDPGRKVQHIPSVTSIVYTDFSESGASVQENSSLGSVGVTQGGNTHQPSSEKLADSVPKFLTSNTEGGGITAFSQPPSTVASSAALQPAASAASIAAQSGMLSPSPSEPVVAPGQNSALSAPEHTASTPSFPSNTEVGDVTAFSQPPSTVASSAALQPATSVASIAAQSDMLSPSPSEPVVAAVVPVQESTSPAPEHTASTPSLPSNTEAGDVTAFSQPPSTIASAASLQTVQSKPADENTKG